MLSDKPWPAQLGLVDLSCIIQRDCRWVLPRSSLSLFEAAFQRGYLPLAGRTGLTQRLVSSAYRCPERTTHSSASGPTGEPRSSVGLRYSETSGRRCRAVCCKSRRKFIWLTWNLLERCRPASPTRSVRRKSRWCTRPRQRAGSRGWWRRLWG